MGSDGDGRRRRRDVDDSSDAERVSRLTMPDTAITTRKDTADGELDPATDGCTAQSFSTFDFISLPLLQHAASPLVFANIEGYDWLDAVRAV
jgi:hypothetical protein